MILKMIRNIEVSVVNETTLLVKEVTVHERFNNKNFGKVLGDVVYVDDLDETKTIQFASLLKSDQCNQLIILLSKGVQATGTVKITWIKTYIEYTVPSL